MNHLFVDEVISKFVENINNDPREMTQDDWDEVLEYSFNSSEDYYDWNDYSRDYDYMLCEIHNYAEEMGFEPQYWVYNKMINLYMYIVARELVAECKENIIKAWDEENEEVE